VAKAQAVLSEPELLRAMKLTYGGTCTRQKVLLQQ
jgi:hypothetical protein